MGTPMDYNSSVFHRELKINYGSVPQSPTAYNPSVFHREFKKNYGSVPHSPTESPTAYNPSVFHREFKKNYGSVPQSPTDSPTVLLTYITDGLTDGIPTPRSARMSDTCPSCRCTDGSKSLAGYQLIADGI
jgi:hypothetical protein